MNKAPLRLVAAGDLGLAGSFLNAARPKGESVLFHFAPVAPVFSSANLVLVNLEGPIGSEGVPRCLNRALIYNEPAVLEWLKTLPNPVCILANNHILDYGPEALQRTLTALDAAGIRHVGAGMDAEGAERELKVTIDGQTLAILAATSDEPHVGSMLASGSTPGAAGIGDIDQLCKRVAKLAAEVDAVIVVIHNGFEYHDYPDPAKVRLFRCLAEAGACLVLGHHPHVRQGVEMHRSSLLAYSLGNLLLPPLHTSTGRVQYRKPASRSFTLLQADLIGSQIADWTVIAGKWSENYQLIPHSLRDVKPDLDNLSKPLSSPDYLPFWENYRSRRAHELKSESLRDAFAKLPLMDWGAALGSLSLADLKRVGRRVGSALRVS